MFDDCLIEFLMYSNIFFPVLCLLVAVCCVCGFQLPGVGIDYVQQQGALHVCRKSGSSWGDERGAGFEIIFLNFLSRKNCPRSPMTFLMATNNQKLHIKVCIERRTPQKDGIWKMTRKGGICDI